MALSEEDRLQATELLSINERRLRIRDKQIARYGDAAAPDHLILDAEDIRKQILALKAILEPELPDEISGLVKRRLEDDYFIFQQTLGAKQDVAILREEVASVKDQLSRDQAWRLDVKADVRNLKRDNDEGKAGRRRNLRLQLLSIGLWCIVVVALVLIGVMVRAM